MLDGVSEQLNQEHLVEAVLHSRQTSAKKYWLKQEIDAMSVA
jgi:hypothetical protein